MESSSMYIIIKSLSSSNSLITTLMNYSLIISFSS